MINGRKHLAFMGFSPFWFDWKRESPYDESRAYFISDRSVYRPNQEVKFKFWIGNTDYNFPKLTDWGGKKVFLKISNPGGDKILEKDYVLDSFGGLSDKITLDKSARLGFYHFKLVELKDRSHLADGSILLEEDKKPEYSDLEVGTLSTSGSNRLERHKKSEYEVTVQTPEDPVLLGDKVKVTIEAKYNFGAPVTDAKVNYKILRKKHSTNWYPVRPWDWFYGNGYAWFTPDSTWYPGWKIWGCPAPIASWYPRSEDPPITRQYGLQYGYISQSWYPRNGETPEVIAQKSGLIDSKGKFEIEINTESAKILSPNNDQKYDIEVEVIDQSRKTVRGNGTIFVASNPFKVYTWLDRGFYQPNDQLNATVQARRIDGKPVSGQAVVKIFRIEYARNSKSGDHSKESRQALKPIETEIHRASLTLKEEGSGSLSLKAPKSGQYRLSCVVTDSNGRKIEGGNLFSVRASGEQVISDLHFNDIELIPEKAEYAPGETARLLINTDRKDATVLLFLRSVEGVCNPPQTIRMNGQTKIVDVKIEKNDMPNIFIEALTVSNGRVFTIQKELVVPPEKKILNLTVVPDKEKYRPGEKAKADLLVTDLQGKPVSGQLVVTVYDKSVEYISGGYNLENIKEFFWKRRRLSLLRYTTNLSRIFPNVTPPDSIAMTQLDIFDDLLTDQEKDQNNGGDEKAYRQKQIRKFSIEPSGFGRPILYPMMARGVPRIKTTRREGAIKAPPPPPLKTTMKSMMKMMMDNASMIMSGATPMMARANSASSSDKVKTVPIVGKNFADTVFWTGTLKTDQNGKAQIELTMPETLTTWKIRAWTVAPGTRVGEGSAEIQTDKDGSMRTKKP